MYFPRRSTVDPHIYQSKEVSLCPQPDSIPSPFLPLIATSNISILIKFSALCLRVCSASCYHLRSQFLIFSSAAISFWSIPVAKKSWIIFAKNILIISGSWTKFLKMVCPLDTILSFTFTNSRTADYLHRSWQTVCRLLDQGPKHFRNKVAESGRGVTSTGTGSVWYPMIVAGAM